MEQEKNGVAQTRGKLDIEKVKDSMIAIDYSGTIVLTTKEEMSSLQHKVKTLKNQRKALSEENAGLKEQLQRLQKQLQVEQEQLQRIQVQYQKVTEKYQKFLDRQGEGRKSIITDEVKQCIISMYKNGQKSPMEIYKVLTINGFKGNYETVRKYIRTCEEQNKWL